MILKLIRFILGRLIIFLNFVFSPRKMKRTTDKQNKVNKACEKLSLYQFYRCPFCVRVRRMMTRLNLNIVCLDVKKSKKHEADLIAGGGKRKVPCLRIEEDDKVTWMYESVAINEYLSKRFGN
ncbi:hypothetical protein DID80_01310 [Candidatus Marinamargulisbacteria bacterium SCGC AAA071-K20]|nr:hypothetical protein DID80_01310 [Candidatus Marinamargulisbacteria bacterium SCGC AAA071-K20]